MPPAPLDGFTVGVTADRRWQEQAELLNRRGIGVLHGPAIHTLPLTADPSLRAVTTELIERPPDQVVANTAIGVRAWFSAAESEGLGDRLLDALRSATVVARGPKAAGAVHALGLEVAWRAESETLGEVVQRLLAGDVSGKRIALQRDGSPSGSVAAELRRAGAEVIEVAAYRCELPDDVRPAVRLVEAAIDGRVQAVTFTSGPAVHNLVAIAGEQGMADDLCGALADAVLPACVGPVCADAARAQGFAPRVMPSHARLGPLVRSLSEQLECRVLRFDVDGVGVVMRGAVVEVGDERAELTGREVQLLQALALRSGSVVAKRELLNRAWGDTAIDPHVVEVTVGRLRRRVSPLGLTVTTVARRGYRLSA